LQLRGEGPEGCAVEDFILAVITDQVFASA
jgi:hypothetical protein